MKEQIQEMVEGYWNGRLPALQQLAEARARQIENLLILEDHQQRGRKGDKLKKALGAFGADALDLDSLSSSLEHGGGGEALGQERFDRVRGLQRELAQLRQALEKSPPACTFMDLSKGPEAIAEGFAKHIAPMAKRFRTLRLAELEAGAQYDPAQHEVFFENFDWRQLDNGEMSLCPPMVVFSQEGADPAAEFTTLLHLLSGGKPLKVVLLRTGLETLGGETGREAALKATLDPELLLLSLRKVYFCQASPAGQTPLKERLAGVLRSPWPGVFSVFTANGGPRNGTDPAASAFTARAFPSVVYDPDRAPDFVSCLDLSENPEPEAHWAMGKIAYLDEEGHEAELERPFTFADFALASPGTKEGFSPLPDNEDDSKHVPLWEFLELSPVQRRGATPFIYTVDKKKKLARVVPSQAITARTANRLHLWQTLQELCGIGNPYVKRAEAHVAEQLASEKEASLSQQKADLEARIGARQQEAVAAAMKNLALRLTGMAPLPPAGTGPAAPGPAAAANGGGAQAAAPAEAAPAPAEPAVEAAPAVVSEQPWIEIQLCTACDECIAINKKIFAYDANKKAMIKDPKGGPFKDIVRAAEKCSSGAIHPGQPWDPNEKDLEKWVKRAEAYQ